MTVNFNTHVPSSSAVTVNAAQGSQSQALTFEGLQNCGFKAMNDTLLRSSHRVYVYFHEEKGYLLAPINLMTERSYPPIKRDFISFVERPSNELTLLYKEEDHRGVFYKHIVQDGTQMSGKGEYPIDEIIVQKTEEEIDSLKKIPISTQLTQLGFTEAPCHQQLFQGQKESTIQYFERQIKGKNDFYMQTSEMLNRHPELGQDAIDAELKSIKESNEKAIQDYQLKIAQLKNEPWHMQAFTKIVEGGQPKIFMVILKDGQIYEIATSIHRSDSRQKQNWEIKGKIIAADLGQSDKASKDPSFILENEKGEKSQVRFEHRDNEHRDYFTVWCEPM